MRESDFKKLTVVYRESKMIWCYCIYHSDTKRPNLSISLSDKYLGRWKCWACNRDGRLSEQQMDRLSISNPVTYHNNKSTSTRWLKFINDCKSNLSKFPLLEIALATQLNISAKSLSDWDVGYDGQSYIIPMYREDLVEYSRDQAVCGAQRRFPDGSKKCITGSQLGYMYPFDYYCDSEEDYLFICEGFSDGISVWDLGLPSYSRPSCHYKENLQECLYEINMDEVIQQIVIIPDNDKIGKESAKQLYKELYNYHCSIFDFKGAKDIREYIKLKGKQQVKKELLDMVL